MIEAIDKQILLAQNLLVKGQIAECLQELSAVLVRQPDNGRAQAIQGHIQLRYLKDFVTAEESFKIAMRNSPNYTSLYIDYAFLLFQTERYTETIAVINKGLEVIGIEKDKLFRIYGNLYERQGKWEDAIDYYIQALKYTLEEEFIQQYETDISRVILKKSKV